MDLDHIHLGSCDVAASSAFYVRYFEFSHAAEHGQGVFLRNAEGFLLAIDPVDDVPELPAWFHVGFGLTDADAVRALYARMQADGVVLATELRDFGAEAVAFYCLDPDGYRIEVSWHAG